MLKFVLKFENTWLYKSSYIVQIVYLGNYIIKRIFEIYHNSVELSIDILSRHKNHCRIPFRVIEKYYIYNKKQNVVPQKFMILRIMKYMSKNNKYLI